jgi:hypothetical protein
MVEGKLQIGEVIHVIVETAQEKVFPEGEEF